MAGSAGRSSNYVGMLDLGNGDRCELSIRVERVSFLLASVANKHRFVRRLVNCGKQTGLTMSSATDRLEMTLDKRMVPAVLIAADERPQLCYALEQSGDDHSSA